MRYDPVNDVATRYFDAAAHFAEASTNITSLHVLSNGNLVLSAASAAELGNVVFEPNDLVEYNSVRRKLEILFDGSALGSSRAITSVHWLRNGNLLLGFDGGGSLGGLSFAAGDLVEYDLEADVAAIYFEGSSRVTPSGTQVEALHVIGDAGPSVADENGPIAYWRLGRCDGCDRDRRGRRARRRRLGRDLVDGAGRGRDQPGWRG